LKILSEDDTRDAAERRRAGDALVELFVMTAGRGGAVP
jgi:hypothetical protein